MKAESAPEHWSANSGHRDVAKLDIPADASAALVGFMITGNKLGITADFLYRRAVTIYGGSNEIQRNLVARHVLGA